MVADGSVMSKNALSKSRTALLFDPQQCGSGQHSTDDRQFPDPAMEKFRVLRLSLGSFSLVKDASDS